MKKIIACLFLSLMAITAHATRYSQIVFFGDSLTDNGNLYNMFYKLVPSSPPYYLGHFTNSTTWAERVGKYYYDKYYIDVKNYAVGGATATYHWPDGKHFSPATLDDEVNAYFNAFPSQNRSHVLYAIWIGANDYFYDEGVSNNEAAQKVVDKISTAVTEIVNRGGQNFLILNLPDISRTPFGRSGEIAPEKLQALSKLHNEKLTAAINDLMYKFGDINITTININEIFATLVDKPDVYNQKYQAEITNTTDSCWSGDVTVDNFHSAQAIDKSLRSKWMAVNNNSIAPQTANFSQMSMAISSSPSLSVAYRTAAAFQNGLMPCRDPKHYLFWDNMHPTSEVHRILSKVVIEELNKM